MTECYPVKSHLQNNDNFVLYVMVNGLLYRCTVQYHHTTKACRASFKHSFSLLYFSKACVGAMLQLSSKTDVVRVYKVFWQEALFPVVQQHQGHNMLAYSWQIRAQVDQTASLFLMEKSSLLGHIYQAEPFPISLTCRCRNKKSWGDTKVSTS